MKVTILVIQLCISVLLIGLILMQSKGTGLGRAFGSTSYHSRRGLETLVFRATIILAVIFVSISIAAQLI